MKHIKFILIATYFLAGCYVMQGFEKVKYKSYSTNDTGCTIKVSTPIRVSMKIPNKYTFKGLASNNIFEKQYWYRDGSVIYITDEPNSNITYEFIEATGKSSERFFLRDTMTLSGKNKNGKYWKDIKICQFCVGYSNVTEDNKEMFDRALKSITVNKKSGLHQNIPR